MKQYVVTISRQFGSMGRSIAQALARQLDIDFYDRDIVEETARRMGLPVSVISDTEETAGHERAQHPGRDLPGPEKHHPGPGGPKFLHCGGPLRGQHPGRPAQPPGGVCLRPLQPAAAELHRRLQNCTQKLGMDEATARRMIREVDRARELYHRRYCPEVKDVFTDHDLMLDSSRFGVEGSARLLAHIAQTMFDG